MSRLLCPPLPSTVHVPWNVLSRQGFIQPWFDLLCNIYNCSRSCSREGIRMARLLRALWPSGACIMRLLHNMSSHNGKYTVVGSDSITRRFWSSSARFVQRLAFMSPTMRDCEPRAAVEHTLVSSGGHSSQDPRWTQKPYIARFLHTMLGPDYYVPP